MLLKQVENHQKAERKFSWTTLIKLGRFLQVT